MTFSQLLAPWMGDDEYFFEYDAQGLILKEEKFNQGNLISTISYNWSESEVVITKVFADGSSYSMIGQRITSSDVIKFGSVGYVKSMQYINGNTGKFYYRSYDNTLQSSCVIYSNQPNLNQEMKHYNWTGWNYTEFHPFNGCMMGDNCSNSSPNWSFTQIEGSWSKTEYYPNKYDTRNFGMKFLPVGPQDGYGITQMGSINLMSKITQFGSLDQNDVTGYTTFTYEFDNQGRVIKEIATTNVGWVTQKLFEYFD